jgi:hypothetical protein
MTTPESITAAKDIIVAAAAVAATIIGFRGLGSWRRQLTGMRILCWQRTFWFVSTN